MKSTQIATILSGRRNKLAQATKKIIYKARKLYIQYHIPRGGF